MAHVLGVYAIQHQRSRDNFWGGEDASQEQEANQGVSVVKAGGRDGEGKRAITHLIKTNVGR